MPLAQNISPNPPDRPVESIDADAVDLRFRTLLKAEDWAALPQIVRQRFSKSFSNGELVIYRGTVTKMRMSFAGWLLAQAMRIVGAPLPICTDVNVPSLVCVSEHTAGGGQLWTRMYGRKDGFPQTIHSAKLFKGQSGLEECIGFGISISLRCSVEQRALIFTSDAYLLRVFGRQFRLPAWLSPGKLRVKHRDLGDGEFEFSMGLVHPLFGELLFQSAIYHDQPAPVGNPLAT